MGFNFAQPEAFDLPVADEDWAGEDVEAEGTKNGVDGYVDAFKCPGHESGCAGGVVGVFVGAVEP